MNSIIANTIVIIIFGILSILIGYCISWLIKPYVQISLPDVCKTWNKYYAMELSLFLVGCLLTLLMIFSYNAMIKFLIN